MAKIPPIRFFPLDLPAILLADLSRHHDRFDVLVWSLNKLRKAPEYQNLPKFGVVLYKVGSALQL